jgi:hypothetical protein
MIGAHPNFLPTPRGPHATVSALRRPASSMARFFRVGPAPSQ